MTIEDGKMTLVTKDGKPFHFMRSEPQLVGMIGELIIEATKWAIREIEGLE